MRKFLHGAAVSALLIGLGGTSALADGKTAWRLFVSDHGEPAVTVLDAADGTKLDSFALKGPASLMRSDSGKLVLAAQGAAGTVTAISSGIALDDHGDHGDIEVAAPKLTGLEVAGQKPSHVVEHGGKLALFFDGEGVARVLSEKEALEGKAELREVTTPAPHHGVAVAHGEHVLISEPNKEKPDELPVGIRVVDAAGADVGDVHACPDLHGEAASGNILVFACASGLLAVTHGDAGPEVRHIAYGDKLPDGKATTLLGGRGLQYFLGNFGPSAVVLIDPTADDAFRLVELPARRVHFAVDPVRPRFAYIFTEDGSLHRLNVVAGKIEQSVKLTDPYSMDGHWSEPRPRVAVAGNDIFVTDPLKSTIHVVGAEAFAESRKIDVAGKPFNIVAVGGSGETH